MIFKNESTAGELDGFLDRGSRMEGELRFRSSFRVDGHFVGDVESDGHLIVGERGKLEGEIRVGRLLVSGVVEGLLEAGQQVHLAPTARVLGEIRTPSVIIEDGATFDGRCTMTGDKKKSAAPAKPDHETPKSSAAKGSGSGPQGILPVPAAGEGGKAG